METKVSIRKTVQRFAEEKSPLYYLTLFLSGIYGILSIVPYYYIWQILRELVLHVNTIDTDFIWRCGIIVFLSQAIAIIVRFAAVMMAHYMAFRVEKNIRRDSVAHLLTLPIGYFESHDSGSLRRIIDDNASKTHLFIAHILPDMAASFTVPLVLLIVMFIINIKFALVCLLSVILAFLCLMKMIGGNGKQVMEAFMTSAEQLNVNGVEYIRGIPVVKVFNQTVESFQRFYQSIMNYDTKAREAVNYFRTPMLLYTICLYAPTVILVPLCIILMDKTNDPLALFVDCIFYLIIALLFHSTLMTLMTINEGKNMFMVTLEKLNDFFAQESRYAQPIANKEEQGIVFDQVRFTYPEKEKPAIDGISLKFDKQKSYALVGASGSGKSTLLALLAGFYKVDEGSIRIDGENIDSMDQTTLLKKMAIVFQQSTLLKESLRDNIAMGLSIDDDKIIKALEDSQSLDILNRMDDGLNTIIGTKGTYVSGGEVQRIALARAFLRDADVLLLDEATAYADPENEVLIRESIDRLKKDKTTIMIAHRLNSIRDVDSIILMDAGKVLAQGSHQELMEKTPRYRELYEEYTKSVAWKV